MSFQATRGTMASGQAVTASRASSGDFATGRATPRRGKHSGGRKKTSARSQPGKTSDLDYAKIWFKKFAMFHGVQRFEQWQFTADDVIAFLRHQKREGVATWKRLRIAESIDLYQSTFFTSPAVDLTSICGTLREYAKKDQALYALLFLFQHVLKRDMGCVDAVRSTKHKRVPMVMSHDEVAGVLGELRGVYLFIAQILYGAGLRLSECLRLRTKDIDFDQMQSVVRHGKGKEGSVYAVAQAVG